MTDTKPHQRHNRRRREFIQAGLILLSGSAIGAVYGFQKDKKTVRDISPGASLEKDQAGRVVVQEFFSYTCPYCADFDPLVKGWAKKTSSVTLEQHHVVQHSTLVNALALAHRTSVELGIEINAPLFNLVLNSGIPDWGLSPDSMKDWLVKQGAEPSALKEAISSSSDTSRIVALQSRYEISAVPTLVIGGRFVIEGGSFDDRLREAENLIMASGGVSS